MSEESKSPEGQQATAPAQPVLRVLGQFIRDLSFENALVQKGIEGQISPEIAIEVALDARARQAEKQYEVITKYKVTSTNKESKQPLFLLELEFGGLFMIDNVPEEQMHPFLMIECPRMLFPFARRLVADITREGGFPPVNMDNIDFVALYRAELARRAQDPGAAAAPAGDVLPN